jgi:Tfp pilus assembly protein PilV
MKKLLSKRKIITGFSLIEVMVAFSILTIAFIFILSSFPFALSVTKGAENSSLASYLAQEKIEELNSLNYENVNVGIIEAKHRLSSDPSNYLYNFQRETEVIYVNGNLSQESSDQGLKKISVNVYYLEPASKNEKIFNVSTLISQL